MVPKYESGHSLLEISKITGIPYSSVRDILIRAGITLKSAGEGNKGQPRRKSGQVRWNSPYGFVYERGRLVPHPQEFETLRLILRWSKEELSFEDISKKINAQKLRPRSASLWTRFTVRQFQYMGKVLLFLLCFISRDLWAEEAQEFSLRVYETILKKDFKAYSNLLHPNCSLNDSSEKAFGLRSDLLKKHKLGAKNEVMSFLDYQKLRIKNGNPFKYTYLVEPSHYIIVWPLESMPSPGARIDLNPIVKAKEGWKIIDGSCITATAGSGSGRSPRHRSGPTTEPDYYPQVFAHQIQKNICALCE